MYRIRLVPVFVPMSEGLPRGQEGTADLLRRAQEIDEQTRLMLEPYPEYTELIHAAEEAGIARDATLQALRERMSLPVQAFEPGTKVFAKSADGHFYAATLEKIQGRTAHIRFVNGSEHVADMTDLRLFSLTPGQRVQFHSPSFTGFPARPRNTIQSCAMTRSFSGSSCPLPPRHRDTAT